MPQGNLGLFIWGCMNNAQLTTQALSKKTKHKIWQKFSY